MSIPDIKTSLSASKRRLLELMQQVNFGRIDRLSIRNGEPSFDPAPTIVREIKFCGENGPRPELDIQDFLLKAQVVELFDHISRMENGMVQSLEIKYGLPFRMIIEESLRV